MKNKTIAYILVLFIALAAAVVIVSLTQNRGVENSYSNSVIPENLLVLVTTDSIENLAGEIKNKTDYLGSKDATPYNSIMNSLGIKVAEPIKNSDELKALLGVCPLSPAGIVVLDPSPAATMNYFCLSNDAIFKDYLKKNTTLSKQSIEGLDCYKIVSKTEPTCCQFLYINNDTAFIFNNEYYLKKVFKEESKKISDNKLFIEFKKEHKDSAAFVYINSKKIGEYIANMLIFAKPSISQQINISIKDKELAAKSQAFTEALGGLLDIFIKAAKSQDSIYTALSFEKEGLSIESDIRLILAEKTQEAFSKAPLENKLIEYLPEGALMVSQDNFSKDFSKWKNEAIDECFKDLIKNIRTDSKSIESEAENLEQNVFAMYPGYSKESPYLQINLSDEDTIDYNFLQKEKSLEDTNKIFENIEFLLPVKMRFVPGNIRTFNNTKIKQYSLNFSPNEKSIIMQIFKEMEPNEQGTLMIRGNYQFELAAHKNVNIFVGDDKNGKFMNDFLLWLDGKNKSKRIVDTDSYNFIKSKTYSDSSSLVYISISQYLFQVVYNMYNLPTAKTETLKNYWKDKNIYYHAISIKLKKEGIQSKIYVNFADIREVINLFNLMNTMESSKVQ